MDKARLPFLILLGLGLAAQAPVPEAPAPAAPPVAAPLVAEPPAAATAAPPPIDAVRPDGGAQELPAPVPKPRLARKKVDDKPQILSSGATVAEMEAAIVRGTGLYILLDAGRSVLEVRSRGLVLDSVPLLGVEFLNHSPIVGGGRGEVPALPVTWVVRAEAGDFEREVIAPEALRPYVPEDQRTALDEARNPKVIASHDEAAAPPSTYEVHLTNGWSLEILDQTPRTGFFARYAAAVREGWQRLRGQKRAHPPMLAVAMKGDDAQRIHHVFRADLPLIIAPGKS